jgi:hypothetical protein
MKLNFNWRQWRRWEWVIVGVLGLCVLVTVRGCFPG